ncbi:hypothetical protein [Nocardia farcinica]|uniref:hypothetical protein n=1 Tax=Nocardia farcinica TaxID=37329 RepID=UPI002457BCE8|nr:hypothetical protein [Nocardia farcinica]
MSDVTDEARRTRRRAVRTAGPPAEEAAAEAVTVKVAAAPAAETEAAETTISDTTASAASKDPASAKASEAAKTVRLTKAAEASEAAQVSEAAKISEVSEVESARTEDTPAEDEPARARRGWSTRTVVLAAAAAVLVAVMLAGAVISVFTVRSLDQRAERRTAYVQTAEQAILNLTTIDADTAREDIDRILSLASGKFRTEFDGRVDPFLSIVQQAEVRATGEIVEAALESEGENSGQVLVAAKQTLTNAGQEGPQTRHYRFRVTVSESESGLTASNVEFVP